MADSHQEKQREDQIPTISSEDQPGVTTPATADSRSSTSLYEGILGRLKNQRIVALAMVFAVGVAGSSALLENISKIWKSISPHLTSDEASRTLYGRIYEFMDVQRPVSAATIMLALNEAASMTTDSKGEFKLVVPSPEIGKPVLLSIRANGYAPIDFPRLPLSIPLEKLEIPLFPLVDPGPALGQADVAIKNSRPIPLKIHPLDIHSFEFTYTFDPPGLRRWTKIDERLWIEVYDENRLSFFPVLRTETVDGCKGVIVAKSPISEFDRAHRTITFEADEKVQQVFIPGRDCKPLWLRFRHPPATQWSWLQEMRNLK